jgi:hypothetical protein
VEGGLRRLPFERRKETAFARVDLEAKPALTVLVAEIDVAAGEVRDREGGEDRLVRDVLQAFEFQLDLNLGLRRRSQKKKRGELKAKFHRALE